MKIRIPRRIKKIAELVPYGCDLVVDVGTDHGYLPVLVISSGKSKKVIAVDIARSPICQAEETVKRFDYNDKIELRLGDGLTILDNDEIPDVVVIAGMGGKRTIEILKKSKSIWYENKVDLLLAPMDEIKMLRRSLLGLHYRIKDEQLIKEKNKFYPLIYLTPGEEKIDDNVILELGPRLIENPTENVRKYIDYVILKKEKMISNMEKARKKDYSLENKLKKTLDEYERLKEVKKNVLERLANRKHN